MSFSDHLPDLSPHKQSSTFHLKKNIQNIRYSGLHVRWDRQNLFVIAGFVMAGLISTYFAVILPGFQMLFVITGSSL